MHLYYATGEKRQETRTEKDYYDEDVMISTEEVDVTATAKLLMYTTSNGWKGLMTEDRKLLTAPLYRNIVAKGKNLYLCSFDELSNYGVLLSF